MSEKIGVIRQAQQADRQYRWRMGLLRGLAAVGSLLSLIVFGMVLAEWGIRSGWAEAEALWQVWRVPVVLMVTLISLVVLWLDLRRPKSIVQSLKFTKPTYIMGWTILTCFMWLLTFFQGLVLNLFFSSWQMLQRSLVELAIGVVVTLIGIVVAIAFKHGLANAQRQHTWYLISRWSDVTFSLLVFSAGLSLLVFISFIDNWVLSILPLLFHAILASFVCTWAYLRNSIVGRASPLDWRFLRGARLVLPDGTLKPSTLSGVEPKFQIKRIAPDKIGLRFSRRVAKRYLFPNSFYGIRALRPDFEQNTWREIAPPVRVLVPAEELDIDPPKGTWQLEVDTTLMADCPEVRLWYTATDDAGNKFYGVADLVVEQGRLKEKPGFI